MPKSSTRTPSGTGRVEQPLRDLHAEPVVAQEDVADPRDEHAPVGPAEWRLQRQIGRIHRGHRHGAHGALRVLGGHGAERLDLVGMEEEVAAVREEHLGGGVVVDGDRDVHLAVDVVEHAGDRRHQAVEEHVVRVGAARRVEPHARAGAHLDPGDDHGVGPRVDRGVDRGLPPRQRRLVAGRLGRAPRRTELAHRAVQARPHVGLHVVDAVDDRGGTRIGRARFRLLLVGQREHPEREDLVDLGRVVERAVALGRDFGVVVEDDR